MLSVSFSSKCSLFHNSNVFGSCFIHILYTVCAKIKKKMIPAPNGYSVVLAQLFVSPCHWSKSIGTINRGSVKLYTIGTSSFPIKIFLAYSKSPFVFIS